MALQRKKTNQHSIPTLARSVHVAEAGDHSLPGASPARALQHLLESQQFGAAAELGADKWSARKRLAFLLASAISCWAVLGGSAVMLHQALA